MSFFKRMLGDESDLINELYDHLRKIGLNTSVLDPESTEGKFLGGLGNVIIQGRNIQLVQVTKHTKTHPGPKGRSTTVTHYQYHYGIIANVDPTLENKFRAEAKPVKKSFFNRTIVDYKWEGEELAQLLTADSELKNMLIKDGIDNLWTHVGKSFQNIWISRQGDRKEFPTQNTFEAYDRIAQHIRSIIGSQ